MAVSRIVNNQADDLGFGEPLNYNLAIANRWYAFGPGRINRIGTYQITYSPTNATISLMTNNPNPFTPTTYTGGTNNIVFSTLTRFIFLSSNTNDTQLSIRYLYPPSTPTIQLDSIFTTTTYNGNGGPAVVVAVGGGWDAAGTFSFAGPTGGGSGGQAVMATTPSLSGSFPVIVGGPNGGVTSFGTLIPSTSTYPVPPPTSFPTLPVPSAAGGVDAPAQIASFGPVFPYPVLQGGFNTQLGGGIASGGGPGAGPFRSSPRSTSFWGWTGGGGGGAMPGGSGLQWGSGPGGFSHVGGGAGGQGGVYVLRLI